jgi:UPF0271 protein
MIDINADIGEGYDDVALAPYLDRVSIASGGHAGDAGSMETALRLAGEYGLRVGAHPSYPDRAHFGRRPLAAAPEQIALWVTQQTEALAEAADRLGMRLAHVKPHGALYNVAAAETEVAAAVAEAVATFDPNLSLLALSGSRLIDAGRSAGLTVLAEAFADRRYHANGRLVSRETSGSVLTDPEEAAAQASALAEGRPIATLEGDGLTVVADTVCLHSDTPNALNIARAVRAAVYRR